MKTISPKQAAWAGRLADERDAARFDPILVARVDEARKGILPMREFDGLLASLKAQPRKAAPAGAAPAKAEPGYYVAAGEVYVVVKTKDGERTYAKHLVITEGDAGRKTARWVYAPGAGRNLAAEGLAPLTVAEAARLGHKHGICMICAKALTDPASVDRGIGPVCAKKL